MLVFFLTTIDFGNKIYQNDRETIMLTKKAKYALQAVLVLAENHEKGPMLISSIAEETRAPRKFLELILLELKKRGMLSSRKGRGGGYELGLPPEKITVGEVVRLIDGPLAPLPCVSVMAYRKCTECENETTCGIRMVMKEVRDSIASILDGTTLVDVLERVEAAKGRVRRAAQRREKCNG
jgi:Rrf2 family protein